MSFIGKLFGAQQSIDSVLDKNDGHLAQIGQFIGNQQFTEQEKAVAMAGLTEAIRTFSISTANQSTERSQITRTIAILWIKVQLSLVLMSVMSLGLEDHYYFNMLWQITTSNVVMYGTFGVMTYFFGAYGWGAHIKGKK